MNKTPVLSDGQLSVLFSNLAKGCEKQYKNNEAEAFGKLSQWYAGRVVPPQKNSWQDYKSQLADDLESGIPKTAEWAGNKTDRGALRALTWGEKVTKLQKSLLQRHEKQGEKLGEGKDLFLCEICGFIFVGEEAPAICPICKVPKTKISKIGRK